MPDDILPGFWSAQPIEGIYYGDYCTFKRNEPRTSLHDSEGLIVSKSLFFLVSKDIQYLVSKSKNLHRIRHLLNP
jgi:hypothetical protein